MQAPPDEPLEDIDEAAIEDAAGDTRVDIIADADDEGLRLDRVLVRHLPDMSRTRFQALISEGKLTLNGKLVSVGSAKVSAGDHFVLAVPLPEPAEPVPQDIPLVIVYEDDDLIVIDKPAGMVVHPAPGNYDGTLVNALLHHCGDSLSGIGGVRRPGIVHRLDKDTSGLLVVAKNDKVHRGLAAQFADHGRTGPLERAYIAFCWGVAGMPRGTIDAPLARHPVSRTAMRSRDTGSGVARAHRGARERALCHHPLGAAGDLSGRAGPAAGLQDRMPAGDRAHPPDSRPHGAYRPSPARRHGLWRGSAHQGEPARR
jgi:23S rRNA pseudouridine1911/1915/1917 synthase